MLRAAQIGQPAPYEKGRENCREKYKRREFGGNRETERKPEQDCPPRGAATGASRLNEVQQRDHRYCGKRGGREIGGCQSGVGQHRRRGGEDERREQGTASRGESARPQINGGRCEPEQGQSTEARDREVEIVMVAAAENPETVGPHAEFGMRTFSPEKRTEGGEYAGEGWMEGLESPCVTVKPFESAGDVGWLVGRVAEHGVGGDYAERGYGD